MSTEGSPQLSLQEIVHRAYAYAGYVQVSHWEAESATDRYTEEMAEVLTNELHLAGLTVGNPKDTWVPAGEALRLVAPMVLRLRHARTKRTAVNVAGNLLSALAQVDLVLVPKPGAPTHKARLETNIERRREYWRELQAARALRVDQVLAPALARESAPANYRGPSTHPMARSARSMAPSPRRGRIAGR